MAANEQDFDTLIERYRNMAYRLAYGRLGDEQLAEDAVQEAFITAYTHLDELRDPLAFPAWFRQIVLTSCSRLTRGKSLSITNLEDEHDAALASPDPSSDFEAQEEQATVKEAIEELPGHERVVVELFYFADYSQREIADQLAVPITTVKKRLQSASEHLKGKIMPSAMLAHPMFDSDYEKQRWLQAIHLPHYDVVAEPNPVYIYCLANSMG